VKKYNKCPVCKAKPSANSIIFTAGNRTLHVLNQPVIRPGQCVAICRRCIGVVQIAGYVAPTTDTNTASPA